MPYVDGFVLPVPRRNLRAYRRMAEKAGRIWQEHGALEYRECVGDDLDVKMGTPFPRQLGLKRGETVVFSWIVYRSRAHRDEVNAKVMKDPRLAADAKGMPFDAERMLYGGFETVVDLGPARAARARPRRPRRVAGASRRNGRAERADARPSMH
jgi:uncharacterized protein YbaA (DUF1428 family)